jgi:orotate phosphoribosyltransferase
MKADEVRRHFEETGALLTGHFRLSSGLHSDRYLQCALVLMWPERAEALGAGLAALLRPFGATAVVSPALGGVVIGQEVGRGLKVRALFTERVEGSFTLRRGFTVEPGEKVAVAEDVVTTGKSTREVIDVVRAAGGDVVACGAIVDRRAAAGRTGHVDGIPFRALLSLDVPAWEAAACPLCSKGEPLTAPGSRHLAAPR